MSFEQYQEKSITPIDDYTCGLSKDLIEILEKEIRETEESRNHGIKALRDWAVQNPRIVRTRLDAVYLLKQLRFKKYSITAAQETIERHLVLRQGHYGKAYFHQEADVMRPCVRKIFEANAIGLLPVRDKEGRPIVVCRFQNVKPDSSPCLFKDICTVMKCVSESLGENEEFLIRGVVYVVDVSGITTSYLKIMPVEDAFKIGKNGERVITGRHKGFHIVNVPPALNFVVNLGLRHVPPKLRERARFYKNFDELDIVDRKYLPTEWGGEIPLAELAKPIWNMVMKDRDLHMSYFDMQVNEHMYPKACFDGSVAMLKVPFNSDNLFQEAERSGSDAIFGVQGSFRKLEID